MLTEKEVKKVWKWVEENNVTDVYLKDGENSFFSHNGCDALGNKLACEVYECEAVYRDENGEYKHFDCELSYHALCELTYADGVE